MKSPEIERKTAWHFWPRWSFNVLWQFVSHDHKSISSFLPAKRCPLANHFFFQQLKSQLSFVLHLKIGLRVSIVQLYFLFLFFSFCFSCGNFKAFQSKKRTDNFADHSFHNFFFLQNICGPVSFYVVILFFIDEFIKQKQLNVGYVYWFSCC